MWPGSARAPQTAGVRTAKSPATVRKGNVTRSQANAPAMPVTGGRSATTTATAASTRFATRPRAGASATPAGSAGTAALSVYVTTRLVSSLLADVSAGRGCGVSAVNGTVSVPTGSATLWMDRVPVNPDTEESCAGSRVQLDSMDRTAKTSEEEVSFAYCGCIYFIKKMQ